MTGLRMHRASRSAPPATSPPPARRRPPPPPPHPRSPTAPPRTTTDSSMSGRRGCRASLAGVAVAAHRIRDATEADWPSIWPFLHAIVAAGDTFCYDPAMDEATAHPMWMVGPPGRTTVAVAPDGQVLGTANMYAN